MNLTEAQRALLIHIYKSLPRQDTINDVKLLEELFQLNLIILKGNALLCLTQEGFGLINSYNLGNLDHIPQLLARDKSGQDIHVCLLTGGDDGLYRTSSLFTKRLMEYVISEDQLGKKAEGGHIHYYFHTEGIDVMLKPGDGLIFNPRTGTITPMYKETMDLFLNLYYLNT